MMQLPSREEIFLKPLPFFSFKDCMVSRRILCALVMVASAQEMSEKTSTLINPLKVSRVHPLTPTCHRSLAVFLHISSHRYQEHFLSLGLQSPRHSHRSPQEPGSIPTAPARRTSMAQPGRPMQGSLDKNVSEQNSLLQKIRARMSNHPPQCQTNRLPHGSP